MLPILNGSLMRFAPVAMFYAPSLVRAQTFAGESARTTHEATECVDACMLFAGMLVSALAGEEKETILFESNTSGIVSEKILPITRGRYKYKSVEHIRGKA
jgi:ADP-ribosyl-[dinitrogen reductase] hydrolase